jgi:hypothetical protein
LKFCVNGPSILRKGDFDVKQPQNGMERRWGERIQIDIPVHLSANKLAGVGARMRNLSLGGALLKIDANTRLDALVEVSIELPQPSQPPAILLAHVLRKRDQDVGIEWWEFAPSVVKDLLRSPSIRFPL